MSGLDPRYTIAPSLEMYFVDKDTGLPLTGGKVYFFQDEARSVPKDVYKISGTPSDYNYDVLPHPTVLSAVGTFQDDDGNDILPYYFPYISDEDSTVQLYYVEVYSSEDVLQFTREGWPNFVPGSTPAPPGTSDLDSFVPNGQFLLHNNIPATEANDDTAGKISSGTTKIAQGGWTYERPDASTAEDIITFHRYDSFIQEPTANPRYALKFQCTDVGGGTDVRKDICLKFRDVNKFEIPNQLYNLYFEGESTTGSSLAGEVFIRKYFGAGGSTTTEETQGTFTLNSISNTPVNITLDFGSNQGETIGDDDDDYVQVVLRFPVDETFTVRLTNFAITLGESNLDVFPVQTDAQQTAPATAGWLPQPNADGFDLYLPIIMTKEGFDFDDSEIGDIVASGNLSNYDGSICTNGNRLLADGSQYKASEYSDLGIPYQRLGDYYIDGGLDGVPQFGTGLNYVTAHIEETSTNKLMFTTNKVGVVTAIADVNTTFTMTKLIDSTADGHGTVAYSNGDTLVTGIGLAALAVLVTAVSAGTSGMTVSEIKNEIGSYQIFTVTALTAAALGNGAGTGKYLDFYKDSTTSYRMWFKTATEVAPAAGGHTLVELDLDLAMTDKDVAKVLASAISGFQDYQITCVAGSSVPAGSYFTFTANTQKYAVWYKVENVGSQPVVANAIYIEVDINTADTDVQVASKTQLAINAVYFAVPDLRGLFLRGDDPDGEWDIDYLNRFSVTNTLTGGLAGTLEYDSFQKHLHGSTLSSTQTVHRVATSTGGTTAAFTITGVTGAGSGGTTTIDGLFISASITGENTGVSETRPVNSSVVWAVKY